MRVNDIMKHEPASIGAATSLAEAGRQMERIGCGILPVVDELHAVIGVITDRDVCVAVARADVPASRLSVASAMSSPARTCRAEDDVESALATLALHRVRRLPVVDSANRLLGLFSLDDVALCYAEEEPHAAHAAAVARTLRAVCAHPLPALR
jgi:CBS domain-containing protein